MPRQIAGLLLLLILAGCQSGAQTFENPFQTRIPPPGTAAAGVVPPTAGAYDPNANVAPLFTPNNSAAATPPPAVLQPAAAAPATAPAGAAPNYAPPGGFDFRASQSAPVSLPAGTAAQPSATIYRPATTVSSPSESRWGQGSTSISPGPLDRFAQSPSASGAVAHASTRGSEPGGVVQASNVEPAERSSAADRSAPAAGDEQPIRVIGSPTNRQQRQGTTRTITGSRAAEPSPRQDEVIDIMDLPPARSRSADERAQPSVERTSYRRPAMTERDPPDNESTRGLPVDRPMVVEGTRAGSGESPSGQPQATNHASYGHDPDYAWLKGELEYSNIDRRWKLRYIPIDGQTDQHGGSVVLPDSPLLEGFEPGDFIAVQGAMAGRASSGYAPRYELSRVKRLEP